MVGNTGCECWELMKCHLTICHETKWHFTSLYRARTYRCFGRIRLRPESFPPDEILRNRFRRRVRSGAWSGPPCWTSSTDPEMIIEVSSFIHIGSRIGSAVEQAWVRLKKGTIWNLVISLFWSKFLHWRWKSSRLMTDMKLDIFPTISFWDVSFWYQ